MSWTNQRVDHRRLQLELERPAGRRLLASVLRGDENAPCAETWVELAGALDALVLDAPLTDGVLRHLLTCRPADPCVPWSEALLLVFWERLVAIHGYKRRWDRDDESRWSNIHWCFLEAIHRIDPAARPARLGQKILNDTTHHLHDHYAAEWRRARYEIATDPEELLAFADPRPGIDFDGIDLRRVQRSEVTRLRSLCTRGRISDVDFFLQVGTRIYGRDLAECAAAVGLHYEVAKKRCQRMGARIGPNRRR